MSTNMEFTYFVKLTSRLYYKTVILADKDGSADTTQLAEVWLVTTWHLN